MQGAALAPITTGLLSSGQFRRLAVALIAIALALTLVAIEAPAATEAHASGRTEAQQIVAIAKSHLGAKFRMGATGMRYFDCSGFIYRVYAQAGLLNRVGGERRLAAGYYHWFHQRGLASRSNPKVGDLIIWTHNGRISHSGIYIGNGRAISALINPWGVKITHINTIHAHFFAFLHVRLQR
jgi:cell wall-associated NlpC family hydrolase